jgi:hypothetical protein
MRRSFFRVANDGVVVWLAGDDIVGTSEILPTTVAVLVAVDASAVSLLAVVSVLVTVTLSQMLWFG